MLFEVGPRLAINVYCDSRATAEYLLKRSRIDRLREETKRDPVKCSVKTSEKAKKNERPRM